MRAFLVHPESNLPLPPCQVSVAFALLEAQHLAEKTLDYLQACDVVRAWQQQRQLGVLPGFTLVEGAQTEEPGGGAKEEAMASEARAALGLCHPDQEPVNTGRAEEGAGWQR